MVELIKIKYRKLKSLLRVFRFGYCCVLNVGYRLRFLSVKEIPIVINNFNRLTHLSALIAFLERSGFKKIIIIDNGSTYGPLLEYYATTRHEVVRDGANYGHLALWKNGLYQRLKWNYFVYTDSDVLPVKECPENFLTHFKKVLDAHFHLDKVGFGIVIDDLPDSFALKEKVINHEKRFWKNEVDENVFDAPIDTTFALYKPFSTLKFGEVYTLAAYRLGFPYVVRHLPWYVDSDNLSEEEQYYVEHSNNSSGISQQIKGMRIAYE